MRFVPHNKKGKQTDSQPRAFEFSVFFPQYSPNLSEYSTTIGLISQPNSKKKIHFFFLF